MNDPGGIGAQLRIWVLILALWCLLALAFAGQLVFVGEVTWREAIVLSFRDWIPWALLAPLTAWLAFRFPLERDTLAWSIPVHVVACMLALLFCDLVVRSLPERAIAPGGGPAHVPREALPGFRERPPRPPATPGAGRPARPPEPISHRFLVDLFARRAQFNLPVYWIIVSIVQGLQYYRRSQERERRAAELEARLAEAKLEALRMQLHPHFLFNALNAISTLVHKDPNAADEMIANLSELLRASLELSDQQEIPLRQELELADRYLQIQQVRLGERLQIRREIDASALEAMVPTMVLQPIVENAVRHGVEPCPGAGQVTISARREGERLAIKVSDSGGGLKSGSRQGEGVGLSNTRARLAQMYGTSASVLLADGAAGGFAVELQLPFRTATRMPNLEQEKHGK